MALVYDAFDLTLERPVAVKVLRPEADALPDVQRRFQQEARFAAEIHHPHIVAILDFGEDKGHSFLVMERLSGVTLRNEMASGPVPPRRVVMVATEMLTALRSAHRHGVLHRDIKPSNVLLQDDGHIKLTDFGIAKGFNHGRPLPTNPDETMTGVVLGTPGYLAPERAAGLPASVQSDIYSVGAVMVEALTGTRLAAGTELPGGLPSVLQQVAGRAMAVDPKSRFESADAMLDALRPPSNPAGVTTRMILPPAAHAAPAASGHDADGHCTAHHPSWDRPDRCPDEQTRVGPATPAHALDRAGPYRSRRLRIDRIPLRSSRGRRADHGTWGAVEPGTRGLDPHRGRDVDDHDDHHDHHDDVGDDDHRPEAASRNSPLHQLHQGQRSGTLPSGGQGRGGGHGGRGGQG